MKKLLLVSLFALVTAFIVAQEKPFYDGEYLYTTLENGVGVPQKLRFSFTQQDYEKIKSSDLFKKWKEETWSNPKNAKYIEYHQGWDEVIMFVYDHISSCKFNLKYIKLKNGNSLEFIEGSKGNIYLSDEYGIRISFPFKAQNGYGNSVVGTTIYKVDLINGEKKSDCLVFNN